MTPTTFGGPLVAGLGFGFVSNSFDGPRTVFWWHASICKKFFRGAKKGDPYSAWVPRRPKRATPTAFGGPLVAGLGFGFVSDSFDGPRTVFWGHASISEKFL